MLKSSLYPGFQGSCVPRLGDAAVASLILGASERAEIEHIGASNLFRGTAEIGTARVVDKGYVKQDRNTIAANARLGNPSLPEWCQQVSKITFDEMLLITFIQEDVLLLWPFEEGSKYFLYDERRHLATLQEDPHRAHQASYSNAARITTFLRPGVEQFHGAMKGTFKVVWEKHTFHVQLVHSRFLRVCQLPSSNL